MGYFNILKNTFAVIGLILTVQIFLACSFGTNSCELTFADKILFSNHETTPPTGETNE